MIEDKPILFAREGIEAMRAALINHEISSEEFMSAFLNVLDRKLAGETDDPTGTSVGDRMERFFSMVFEVEPLPALPYTGEELKEICRAAVENLNASVLECRADGDHDVGDLHALAALDYKRIGDMLPMDVAGALKAHARLDTADRDWLWSAGLDDRRWFKTRENN